MHVCMCMHLYINSHIHIIILRYSKRKLTYIPDFYKAGLDEGGGEEGGRGGGGRRREGEEGGGGATKGLQMR